MRIGVGFDVHGFDQSRRLVLGGVEILGSAGLAGHSDADVLCHAVADALLGAGKLGDLGGHFPATEQWRDASSLDMLAETSALLTAAGFVIENVDSTIVAEQPRIGPYRLEMISNIAHALQISEGAVSVKATTSDGLGFTGRGEGMAAYAVALIDRLPSE